MGQAGPMFYQIGTAQITVSTEINGPGRHSMAYLTTLWRINAGIIKIIKAQSLLGTQYEN